MLPPRFQDWFAAKGWTVRPHQSALVEMAGRGASVLLVAPTGGGKTLAGFLPSLIALAETPKRARARKLHTLYISPLKALAVDVARNLETPIAEMGLAVTVETRTGDTPAARRQRQRHAPPDILLTTPEQLALLDRPSPQRPIVRGPQDGGAGRIARALQFQARRFAGAGFGPAVATGARASAGGPVGDGGRSQAVATLSDAAAHGWGEPGGVDRRQRRRHAPHHHQRVGFLCALGGTSGAPRHAGCDGGDRGIENRPDLRQHPQPGRAHLPGIVAAQRAELADRAASWLAGAGTAAQGGSGDGQRRAEGGGLHLHPGSRHRLGRGGQGDLHRRAQGRSPAGPAHRPRQSPAGRAQRRAAGAGQPVRSAGMQCRPRRGAGRRAGRRAVEAGQPGRALPAYLGHGGGGSVSCRPAL